METDESGFEPVFPPKPKGNGTACGRAGEAGRAHPRPFRPASRRRRGTSVLSAGRDSQGSAVHRRRTSWRHVFHSDCMRGIAQLYGLRTDYGELHSMQAVRPASPGKDYTEAALLDCEWDEQNPIHLIGHSFGGNTALTLVTLLAQDWDLARSLQGRIGLHHLLAAAWARRRMRGDSTALRAAASCSTCNQRRRRRRPAAHGTLLVAESANDRGASASGGGGTIGGGGGGGAAPSSSSPCSQPIKVHGASEGRRLDFLGRQRPSASRAFPDQGPIPMAVAHWTVRLPRQSVGRPVCVADDLDASRILDHRRQQPSTAPPPPRRRRSGT